MANLNPLDERKNECKNYATIGYKGKQKGGVSSPLPILDSLRDFTDRNIF
jgi:hypothetical protein